MATAQTLTSDNSHEVSAEPILKQARSRGMMEDGWAWIMSGGSMSAYFGVIPPANADGVFMEVGHFDPSLPY
jgi:hypothetical protein